MGFSFLTSKSGLCFFANMSPLALAISAICIKVFMLCFIIWEVSDPFWSKKGENISALIGLVFGILPLLGILGILIFVLKRNNSNYSKINSSGKTMCLLVRVFLIAASSFIFWSMIQFVKYATGSYQPEIPGECLASAILPPIIYLIGMIVLQVCIRALFLIFRDNIYGCISKPETEIETAVSATSVTEIPKNEIPGSNTLITQKDPITKIAIDNKGATPKYFIQPPGALMDNINYNPGINKYAKPENNLVKPVNFFNNNFSAATPVNISSSEFPKKK